jgi:two-component system, cell cycle response regulator
MTRKEFEDLKQSGQLPSPAGVGMKILTLTQKDDCSIDELQKILQADPALTGRILKLATSVGVSGSQPVRSVKEATMRLGLRTVTSLALGFSLVSSSRIGQCSRFDYDEYWTRSLVRALAGQEISERTGRAVSAEAFTCALLGLVGQLALASCHPEDYAELLDQLEEDPNMERCARESQMFGINHLEVTDCLMAEWGLPDSFGEVSMALGREGGDAELEGYSRELYEVLADARIIADYAMKGAQVDAQSLSGMGQLENRLAIYDIALGELCKTVMGHWIEWGEQLSLETSNYAKAVRTDRNWEDEAKNSASPMDRTVQHGADVLVVDDDPVALKLLAKLLQDEGHRVMLARDGKEALAITLKKRPQVVISDWFMPKLDGIELTRALRRTSWGKRIYVLLLTGNDREDRLLTAFDAGVDDYVAKPFKPKLLMARLRAGVRMVKLQEQVELDQEIQRKNSVQMTRMNRQLKEAANTDFLTGLPNRRHAMAHMDRAWKHALVTGTPLSVLMIDIDKFKSVNDTYGHDVGDVVLKETARVIKGAVRRNDMAARMGGEEFLVITPGADLDEARMVGERIRLRVESNHIKFGDFDRNVTISLGVATMDPSVGDIDHLIRLADEAVYVSKSSGRNQVNVALNSPQQAKSA